MKSNFAGHEPHDSPGDGQSIPRFAPHERDLEGWMDEGVLQVSQVRYTEWARRDGREAEGGGLLNRYRAKSSIEGSNPSLSASESKLL